MTDDRWRRVKALFQAAVERPPAERDAFLAAHAGGAPMLKGAARVTVWGAIAMAATSGVGMLFGASG